MDERGWSGIFLWGRRVYGACVPFGARRGNVNVARRVAYFDHPISIKKAKFRPTTFDRLVPPDKSRKGGEITDTCFTIQWLTVRRLCRKRWKISQNTRLRSRPAGKKFVAPRIPAQRSDPESSGTMRWRKFPEISGFFASSPAADPVDASNTEGAGSTKAPEKAHKSGIFFLTGKWRTLHSAMFPSDSGG